MSINLANMVTEQKNPNSIDIDKLSTLDILKVINTEDQKVPIAIHKVLPQIAQLIDKIVTAFSCGGRLIYMGAGTSGRLGVLDASECPPTFGTDPSQVIALIAGGHSAVFKAVEKAEDDPLLGKRDLQLIDFNEKDILVGIAASGRTPYVLGGMDYAHHCGAYIGAIVCNEQAPMIEKADISIVPLVGPEVITGSSRLKAGSAQKMILNMLTTGSMIRSGKVYGNLMVDVKASNQKLIERQKNILIEATGCSYQQAQETLKKANNQCKVAILMLLTHVDADKAKILLARHQGFIRNCL